MEGWGRRRTVPSWLGVSSSHQEWEGWRCEPSSVSGRALKECQGCRSCHCPKQVIKNLSKTFIIIINTFVSAINLDIIHLEALKIYIH